MANKELLCDWGTIVSFEIRKATIEDLESYTKHCVYHLTEKGIGDIFVHPFPTHHEFDFVEFSTNLKKKWTSDPFTPNWEIAWIAISDKKVVGHLNMRCGGIEALVHRMKLGMGIENGYRSLGIGTALLRSAMEWSVTQNKISWIDLSVFEINSAARSLYKKFGFIETHTIEDALRVEDQSINDVRMTLRLR